MKFWEVKSYMPFKFSISLLEGDVIAGFSLDDMYGLFIVIKPHHIIIAKFSPI